MLSPRDDEWLVRLATLHARCFRLVDRSRHVLRGAAEAFFDGALSSEEKEALGVRLYAARPTQGHATGLAPWEAAWFEKRLPPPPARLLVTGAGDGREVVALADQGYLVDACEPQPDASAVCHARHPAGEVICASYADLCQAVLDGGGGDCARLAGRRYDAVVLGWGSFTHVLTERGRARLLEACSRLCPNGPILMSYWKRQSGRRAARLGARAAWLRSLGRHVGRWRGVSGEADETGDLEYLPHCGYGHRFTWGEIVALAAAVGRVAVDDDTELRYPHATLIPEDQAS